MTMSNNVVDAGWTPEPELRENPPRRLVSYEDYPDLNKPNLTVGMGISGAALLGGFILLIIGLSKGTTPLTVLGIILALAGVGLGIFFQQKARAHVSRAEHLVENGVPVIARILSANNMTGSSTYGRFVKYQVVTPGGDMVHREANVDERALPKRIPADATALLDMNSGDVELYCALPFRAIPKASVAERYTPSDSSVATASVQTDPLAGLPTETVPSTASGTMGTISGGAVVPTRRPAAPSPEPEAAPVPAAAAAPKQEQSQEQKQGPSGEQSPKKAGSSGLPWE